MKILHTSDLHLSSPLSSVMSAECARVRRRERLEIFRRLCEEAYREGCRAMIIAGDLFDSERVSKIALGDILDTVRSNPTISFFYLAGNHEGEVVRKSGISLPENLHIFGEDWTSFSLDDIAITGRSTLSRGAFDAIKLDAKKKNIVVLHGELRDLSDEGTIGRRDASERGIDYLALGHYHSYSEEKIDRRCIAVYSGTPDGRGFDEAGEKGYAIYDTDTSSVRFVKFAKRTVHHIKVALDGAMTQGELIARIDASLLAVEPSSIVRVELCGNFEEGAWKSLDAIRARYEMRYFYFELCDSSRVALDPEKIKYDKTLKGEFIRLVNADDTISPKMRDKVISCGLYSLLGEAIYEE